MINPGFQSIMMASRNDKIFTLGYQSGFVILVTDLEFNLIESFDLDQSFDNVYDMKVLDDEEIVICGTLNWKWKMIQTSSIGENDWEMDYVINGYNVGYPYGIQILPNGFLLVGSMAKSDPTGWCAMSLKISKYGEPIWYKQIGDVDINNGADAITDDRLIITGRKSCENSFQDIFITELDTMDVSVLTSIDEYRNVENHKVFPNPFCDRISLTNKNGYNYSIITMSGRIVKSGVLADDQIDLAKLANGIYILKLDDLNGNMGMKRIVKNCHVP
jgi:hypothetical protein